MHERHENNFSNSAHFAAPHRVVGAAAAAAAARRRAGFTQLFQLKLFRSLSSRAPEKKKIRFRARSNELRNGARRVPASFSSFR